MRLTSRGRSWSRALRSSRTLCPQANVGWRILQDSIGRARKGCRHSRRAGIRTRPWWPFHTHSSFHKSGARPRDGRGGRGRSLQMMGNGLEFVGAKLHFIENYDIVRRLCRALEGSVRLEEKIDCRSSSQRPLPSPHNKKGDEYLHPFSMVTPRSTTVPFRGFPLLSAVLASVG